MNNELIFFKIYIINIYIKILKLCYINIYYANKIYEV